MAQRTFTDIINEAVGDLTVLTTEQVQDIVGAMFVGGTHSNIAMNYDDPDGFIDLAGDAADITLIGHENAADPHADASYGIVTNTDSDP